MGWVRCFLRHFYALFALARVVMLDRFDMAKIGTVQTFTLRDGGDLSMEN